MICLKNTLENEKGSICYILLANKPYVNKESFLLNQLKEKKVFESKKGSLYHITKTLNKTTQSIFFLGCGSQEEVKIEDIREGIAKVCKKANIINESNLSFYLNPYFMKDDWIKAIGEGIILGSYSFDKYVSNKKENTLRCIDIIIPGAPSFKRALDEGIILGKMIKFARDLTNEPGSICTPKYLSEKTKILGERAGYDTIVFNKKDIENFRMNAYLAVSKGSNLEPKLIVIKYGNNKKNKTLGLVGKGITFDSGGLSLKPSKSMLTMQGDMGGAASVIGAIGAISLLKIPINIVAVIPSCENMISSKSYHPNDIIKSRSGKTIFISNTDAEGRLTLIDALDYILTENKIDYVVDIATLTGSAEISLGKKIAPVITNNHSLYKYLEKASKISGEKIWQLPNDEDFLELLKSPYADLINSSGNIASTITAGMFVGSVVNNTPWAHIDIAGTSWSETDTGIYSKGATGFGVRLLYHLGKELSIE